MIKVMNLFLSLSSLNLSHFYQFICNIAEQQILAAVSCVGLMQQEAPGGIVSHIVFALCILMLMPRRFLPLVFSVKILLIFDYYITEIPLTIECNCEFDYTSL